MAAVAPASQTANLMVNIFDGTRQPFPSKQQTLVRLIDGNQKQFAADFHSSPNVFFQSLPVRDNLADNWTVLVSADGYIQAGFHPVPLKRGVSQHVDLMLIPKDASYQFAPAKWDKLDKSLRSLFAAGAKSQAIAKDRYVDLLENRPASLAALLNITTAMAQIHLAVGTPLDYMVQLDWETMQQDRFFGYADSLLIDQVRLAADAGMFAPETGSAFFHPGATLSWKQLAFGEANVQLTFHEGDTKIIDGEDCVGIEPDIDYFKDLGAHALFEVIPNTIGGGKTDPKMVYALRWIAGRQAGVPEFNPPYTLA